MPTLTAATSTPTLAMVYLTAGVGDIIYRGPYESSSSKVARSSCSSKAAHNSTASIKSSKTSKTRKTSKTPSGDASPSSQKPGNDSPKTEAPATTEAPAEPEVPEGPQTPGNGKHPPLPQPNAPDTATVTLPGLLPEPETSTDGATMNYYQVQLISTDVTYSTAWDDIPTPLRVIFTVSSPLGQLMAGAGQHETVTYDYDALTWGPVITMGARDGLTPIPSLITTDNTVYITEKAVPSDTPPNASRVIADAAPAIIAGVLMGLPLICFALWWRLHYRHTESYRVANAARIEEAKERAAAKAAAKARRVAELEQIAREREEAEKKVKEREEMLQQRRMERFGGTDDPEFAKYGRI